MAPVSTALLIAGRYRLDHQLATGRFDEVWRGTDLELARPVAVKLLDPDVDDADSISQFRAAACQAASLAHENLVRVFDYYEPEPSDSAHRPFLVMEYVDGRSLADQLDGGRLGAAQTIDVVAQLAGVLQAVHAAGLAHGDIRPQKILLSRDGVAKLFGFSGACPAGSATIGSDLRGLGNLACACLTGRASPAGPRALPGQVPAPVTEFIGALCALESADEPDGAAAIARRAGALRAELGWSAPVRRGTARSGSPAAPPAPPGLPGLAPAVPTQTLARLVGPGGRPAAPAGQPATLFADRMSGKRRSIVAVRTCAVIAIALAAVTIFGALKPNGGAPQADGATKPASVRVTAAQLIGHPVDVVRLRLRRLGLVVRVRWRASESVSTGDVLAIRPAGVVPVHSVIVLVGSTGRPATGTASDMPSAQNSHRHGHSPRHAAHGPASQSPPSSASPSASGTPAPSASPSPSPSGSPSPPGSPPPSGSPSPSSTPPPAGDAAPA